MGRYAECLFVRLNLTKTNFTKCIFCFNPIKLTVSYLKHNFLNDQICFSFFFKALQV